MGCHLKICIFVLISLGNLSKLLFTKKSNTMIRTVIIPDNNILSFNIPDKYIGKKMEIIAFAVDEASEDIVYTAKSQKSFSAIKLNTKAYKFNRDEANER